MSIPPVPRTTLIWQYPHNPLINPILVDILDPIDELVPLFSAFHISAKAQQIGKETALARQEEMRLRFQSHMPPPKVKSQKPKIRPYWEPPVLDYSRFGDIIVAEKQVNRRQGSKEIGWRTEIMDVMIEEDLLDEYIRIEAGRVNQRPRSGYEFERNFEAKLIKELTDERNTVRDEKREITRRHGKEEHVWKEVYSEVYKLVKAARPDDQETHGTNWQLAAFRENWDRTDGFRMARWVPPTWPTRTMVNVHQAQVAASNAGDSR